jgi:nitrate reductase NapAB chaperone NapD
MSILGVVLRVRPEAIGTLREQLTDQPGLDVALDPGDGRMVLVLEDLPDASPPVVAADWLGRIAGWPDVLGTSLVYEYSGPDSPAPAGSEDMDYRAWRQSLDRDSSPGNVRT